MTQSIATDPITFAFEKKKNLLLVGPHGVGKTTRPMQMFEENKVPYLFFNCPTMDVYEDLRGIPTVVDGQLKYIKPSHIEWDKAEFILLDEPNRAHIKVIGTLYELIQFKRINGHVLPNLKAVWTTMNPSDGEYAALANFTHKDIRVMSTRPPGSQMPQLANWTTGTSISKQLTPMK